MTQTPHPLAHRRLEVEIFREATVASFVDELIRDEVVIDAVGEALYDLLRRDGQVRLALNFARVRAMSSALFMKLFKLRAMVAEAGGRLVLCGVAPQILRGFKLFPKHGFTIYDTEEQALHSF